VHGRDYYFLSPTEFERQRAAGAFAESAEVHGLMYGTLHSEVHRVLDAGRHVLMAIDVQGAAQFVKSFPQSVLVFLLPPSAAELLRRLQRRDSEDPDSMARRVRSALMELGCVEQYEYVIVNDNLDRAVSDACSILDAENHRRCRLMPQLSSRLASLTHGLQHEPQSLTT
jgi:guanylate kinase